MTTTITLRQLFHFVLVIFINATLGVRSWETFNHWMNPLVQHCTRINGVSRWDSSHFKLNRIDFYWVLPLIYDVRWGVHEGEGASRQIENICFFCVQTTHPLIQNHQHPHSHGATFHSTIQILGLIPFEWDTTKWKCHSDNLWRFLFTTSQ